MIRLTGARALFRKEVLRCWKVAFQTVAAPVLSALLYLLNFGHVLSDRVEAFPGVEYTSFLVSGLVMMSVLQNAFANSSSSLAQTKITTANQVFPADAATVALSLIHGLRGCGHRAWAGGGGTSFVRCFVVVAGYSGRP